MSTSTVSVGSEKTCRICCKPFTRKDLRNRHQRRCITRIGQSRSSKQKSCARCVASKLKCDLSLPACHTCCARNPPAPCIYPETPTSRAAMPSQVATLERSQECRLSSTLRSASSPADEEGYVGIRTEKLTRDILSDDSVLSDEMLVNGSMALNPQILFAPTPKSNNFHEFDNYHDPFDLSRSIPPSVGSQIDFRHLMALGASAEAPDIVCRGQPSIPSHSTSTATQKSQMMTQTLDVTRETVQTNSAWFNTDGTIKWLDGLHGNNSLTSRDSEDTATRYTFSNPLTGHGSIQNPIPQFMKTKEMLDTLRSYPINMLQKDYNPPFLHHTHYRCSESGLDEGIAIALCCVGAMKSVTEKSAGFVGKMISNQREALVTDFHATESIASRLAGIHALHIYQMLGLLFSECYIARRQIKEAEMSHSFVLKIVRWTVQEYLKEHKSLAINQEDWKNWCEAETLRRTILLVHVSNFLSICFERRNDFFYEPLEDGLVDSLWVPAPEMMWEATNEQEWKKAKEYVGYSSENQTTMSALVNQFQYGDRVLLHGAMQSFDDMPELTRLILSCIVLDKPAGATRQSAFR